MSMEIEGMVVPEDMRGIFSDLTETQNKLREIKATLKQLQQRQQELTMEALRLEGQARYLQGKIAAYQERAPKVPVELDDKQKLTKLLENT